MITYESLVPKMVNWRDVDEINLLLPQLTKTPRSLLLGELVMITMNAQLVVARDETGTIKGMATMAFLRIPTADVGLIEDVVVDAALCGHGVGTALILHLLEYARKIRVRRVELTSRPERTAANRLYQKIGFELRETNQYRMTL